MDVGDVVGEGVEGSVADVTAVADDVVADVPQRIGTVGLREGGGGGGGHWPGRARRGERGLGRGGSGLEWPRHGVLRVERAVVWQWCGELHSM